MYYNIVFLFHIEKTPIIREVPRRPVMVEQPPPPPPPPPPQPILVKKTVVRPVARRIAQPFGNPIM